MACTLLSYQQVKTWRNSLELWKPIGLHFPYYAGRPGTYRPPDFEGRVAFLEGELARNPLAPIANNSLASTLYAVGDVARALPLYERAARHAPDSPAILTNLANAFSTVTSLAVNFWLFVRDCTVACIFLGSNLFGFLSWRGCEKSKPGTTRKHSRQVSPGSRSESWRTGFRSSPGPGALTRESSALWVMFSSVPEPECHPGWLNQASV